MSTLNFEYLFYKYNEAMGESGQTKGGGTPNKRRMKAKQKKITMAWILFRFNLDFIWIFKETNGASVSLLTKVVVAGNIIIYVEKLHC